MRWPQWALWLLGQDEESKRQRGRILPNNTAHVVEHLDAAIREQRALQLAALAADRWDDARAARMRMDELLGQRSVAALDEAMTLPAAEPAR